jgi:TonB-dependent SusC/RagA subfamily outer membrane receptor
MPALLIYLLKANIALTLFFLGYRWGLRRLTFYVLNRFFLLTGIVFSSVFPLVDVNALLQRHQEIEDVVAYVPDLSALQAQPDAGFTAWHLLIYIFWTGVAVMAIRFIIQLCSLWSLHRRSQPGTLQQQPVKLLDSRINPFSFFRHIYINPSLHQPSELGAILQHELVHVKEWHTIDVLTAELNNIFYWFNPGAWLMKTAIRENLEFITDRRMLQQGVDPKAYQYNLIKVSGIPYATAIANNFNFSHLKNRIKMMNQKRSAKYNLLRYLVLGCVVAVALLSLNFSRAAFIGDRITIVTDTVPPPPAPVAPVTPVEPLKEVPAVPPVPESPGEVPPPAPPPAPPAPAEPGKIPVPPAPPQKPAASLREVHVYVDTVPALDQSKKPLIFVDGVKQGYAIPADLKGEDIKTMNVWKPVDAVPRYGQEASDGAIEIFTRKEKGAKRVFGTDSIRIKVDTKTDTKVNTNTNVNIQKNVNVKKDTVINRNINVVKVTSAISLRGVDSLRQPLVIIDGIAKTLAALNALPKEKITSVNVLKDNNATTLYGAKGINGVIEVKTIDGPAKQ